MKDASDMLKDLPDGSEFAKGAGQDVPSIDWLALKISYLIAQKNWITAVAERDTSLDGWTYNYANDQANIDIEIEELFEKANSRISGN